MIKSSSHLESISLPPATEKHIEDILVDVGRFKADVDSILKPYQKPAETLSEIQRLERLFYRFHTVAKQLQKRQRQRTPFLIDDEYDVQDLLHALLKIDFKDIRAEDCCPSYASTSPRIDFFLRKEEIGIEAKIASKKHPMRKIREELIIDKEYYQKRSDVKTLLCLVYDPNEIIENVDGFENDLYEKSTNYEVRVYVVPKR